MAAPLSSLFPTAPATGPFSPLSFAPLLTTILPRAVHRLELLFSERTIQLLLERLER